ncbi:hypothetical protein GOM49_15325 [Clostridium bovifaecis]|uniref:Uncharacterized protein n=1 Tax=Clostridium bovifaecis TaxID=2184719 RepID=A0A6I6ERB3_9CLOT|nr:hypothetical protein GOM49_15325 [Clostridium bovifaecis]
MNKEIGDYTSLVYNHDYSNNIGFKIEFSKDNKNENLNIEYILFRIADEIRRRNKSDIKDILDELIKKNKSYLVKQISFYLKKNKAERIVVERFIIEYANNKKLEIFLSGGDYFININNNSIEISNLIIPDKFYFRINEEELSKASIEELKDIGVVYSTLEMIKKSIRNFTDNIIHISSFRNKPERVEYITRLTSLDTVGSKGENNIHSY